MEYISCIKSKLAAVSIIFWIFLVSRNFFELHFQCHICLREGWNTMISCFESEIKNKCCFNSFTNRKKLTTGTGGCLLFGHITPTSFTLPSNHNSIRLASLSSKCWPQKCVCRTFGWFDNCSTICVFFLDNANVPLHGLFHTAENTAFLDDGFQCMFKKIMLLPCDWLCT